MARIRANDAARRLMAAGNPTWGEDRIANELKLKLGIRVSPRTVQKYLRRGGPARTPDPEQRWLTFVHNHAKGIVACDFFFVVTATFRILYIFVMLELGTRRIVHLNLTAYPTAEWTLQQFREALPADHPYRFVIHDRDSIFSRELDRQVTHLGVRVLRTPIRAELYADGIDGTGPVRQQMERAGQLAGAAGGYAYRAQVPSTRPATDYTARVIPHLDGIAVPLEAARILWQR